MKTKRSCKATETKESEKLSFKTKVLQYEKFKPKDFLNTKFEVLQLWFIPVYLLFLTEKKNFTWYRNPQLSLTKLHFTPISC